MHSKLYQPWMLKEWVSSTHHTGNVHDVADSGGLDERNRVHAACQQMTPTPHSAGRNIRTLLHPAHDLQIHQHGPKFAEA